ncbi:MAG TPA: thioesterase family protein [Candidatus Limnocylindria bacterium]|nr:thioesterase family protein [Candidatus Limnocylindria bacterium]
MTDSFRHHTRLEVRFRDIDAFGHVNNASFVTYLEQARVRFLIDVLRVDVVQSLPVILAALQVDFRSPILFGDEVGIGTRVDWIGNTSLSMSHRMTARGDGGDSERVVAEAGTVLVAYDYETERPIRVPDAWRTAFAAHEGRSLERPA